MQWKNYTRILSMFLQDALQLQQIRSSLHQRQDLHSFCLRGVAPSRRLGSEFRLCNAVGITGTRCRGGKPGWFVAHRRPKLSFLWVPRSGSRTILLSLASFGAQINQVSEPHIPTNDLDPVLQQDSRFGSRSMVGMCGSEQRQPIMHQY